MDKPTVWITGSNGFIGRHLCNTLENKCYIYKIDRDEKSYSHFKHCPAPDIVVHLAGISKPNITGSDVIRGNFDYTRKLVDNINYRKRAYKFIFASTINVYGNSIEGVDEDSNYGYPRTEYSTSKMLSEIFLEQYCDNEYGKVHILRLPSVIGNSMTHGLIYDVINKLQKSPEIELWGIKPGKTKTYIHIDDVCNVINAYCNNALINRRNNIVYTKSQKLTVEKVVNIIAEEMNINISRIWTGNSYKGDYDIPNIYTNHEISTFPFKYKTPEEAIRATIREIIKKC